MAKAKASKTSLATSKPNEVAIPNLLGDIRQVIEAAREHTAQAVNSTLVTMYWQIGKRVRQDVLGNERADYGKEIVQTLSAQLTAEYGKGFTEKALWRMMQFAEVFLDADIVATLSRQLSWSHFVELIPLDTSLKRDFYTEMCRVERWSVRTLRHKIGHLLYERTAVAKKPEDLIADDIAALRDEDRLTPDMVFRDPYFLDFLGLMASTQKRMSSKRYSVNSKRSSWNWVPILPSSLAKNGSRSTTRTITSTCCSITVDCDAWSPST